MPLLLVALVGLLGTPVAANTPPRFVLDGQSEIVIRLTEGEATPAGEYFDALLLLLLRHSVALNKSRFKSVLRLHVIHIVMV